MNALKKTFLNSVKTAIQTVFLVQFTYIFPIDFSFHKKKSTVKFITDLTLFAFKAHVIFMRRLET